MNGALANQSSCQCHNRGIGGCGDNVVIRNNTVYNGCMQNYAGKFGSWSQVVSYASPLTTTTAAHA
jgi:hypothetical protein